MNLSGGYTISASGAAAASLHQFVAAQNLANVMTPNYRRFSVSQTALADGVSASMSRESIGSEDIVTDVTEMMGSVYALKANLLALKVGDAVVRTALNLRA